MTDTTTTTTAAVNPYVTAASSLAADAVAFVGSSRETDTKATPFGRSTLAAVIGGLSSLAMAESLLLAAAGSPKSPATGKPIKTVSGLRHIDGGERVYQAWKAISLIVENVDADAFLVQPDPTAETDEGKAGVAGKAVIRPAVVGFILNEGDGPKALFGRNGIAAFVKAAMTDHAASVAKLEGVEPEGEGEGEGEGTPAPQSLSDRVAALMVALQAADDGAFIDAQTALAALSDYIDTRWEAIADATNPDHGADKAEGDTALADAVASLPVAAVA